MECTSYKRILLPCNTHQRQNAVLIKLAACELKTQTQHLIMGNLPDRSYINLLRDAIDSFKPIFIEWVKSFDPTDDITDGWLYICPLGRKGYRDVIRLA